MGNEIWHLTDDFTKLPAVDVLKNILRDDSKNYDRAESELGADIRLLDDAIILYVESLQAAYRLVDKWKSNISNRAAMAMLVSTLNYVLLARHGVSSTMERYWLYRIPRARCSKGAVEAVASLQ